MIKVISSLMLCIAVAGVDIQIADSSESLALMRKEVRAHQHLPRASTMELLHEEPLDRMSLERLVEQARIEAGYPKDLHPDKVDALLQAHTDLHAKLWPFSTVSSWLRSGSSTSWGWLCARASALAYRKSYVGLLINPLFPVHKRDMEESGWKVTKDFYVVDYPGSDLGQVWKNADETQCILAFRGSEDLWDFVNDVLVDPVAYPEIGYKNPSISQGVKQEFEPLFQKMKEMGGFEHMRGCKEIAVTGHSLGGALAALFAAAANKQGDPIGARLTVDYLYQFGPIPSSSEPLSNDKSSDGCFNGTRFYNVLGGDTDFAIWVGSNYSRLVKGTLKHAKVRSMGRDSFGKTTEEMSCSQAAIMPSKNTTQDLVRNELNIPLHLPQLYISAMSSSE